jgi:hypothetical protein
MKLIYTHENFVLVSNARALLEHKGIEVVVRNEYIGGGRGEIPVFETWPELWVVKGSDYEQAEQLIVQMMSAEEGEEWRCPSCDESNADSFEFCWRCGEPSSQQ